MNGTRSHWLVAGLAALAGALAALVAVEHFHANDSGVAYAQVGEVAGNANYVLAMMGNTVNDATPIIVIDTRQQVILVYDYMVSRHAMYLRQARQYINDRELVDNNFLTSDLYSGPSVGDIRKVVRGR